MKIAVCIATYRRPVMLATLLRSLGDLALDAPAPEVVIVVVDNDANGSAETVVEAARSTVPWRIVSSVEPERNIALARNRGVALALADGADWVAFVDDDEMVTARWLAELLRVQAEFAADVVGGPVVNVYPDDAPRWIVASELPRRLRLATGAGGFVAETSNALVSGRVLAAMSGPFDARFGLSGGSDSHLFHRAHRTGARFAWAADAVVRETLPRSRASAGWLLRRGFRVGNTAVLVARAMLPLRSWLPRRFAAACYRIAIGTVRLLPALVLGRVAVVQALHDICLGAGAIAAMGGFRYVEYRRPPHGS